MGNMEAVVLAAGEGSRLRPLTDHRPKPMLPAATKPILSRVFDQLITAGITDITVVVGYERERVQSYFGPTYRNVPLSYVTQEKQLGSGHALSCVADNVDQPCLVVYGDQLVDHRIIEDVVSAHEPGETTIGVINHGGVEQYGGAILDGDAVTELVEHPTDDRTYRLNAGVYAFSETIFDAIDAAEPRHGEYSLIDGVSELINRGDPVTGVVSEGFWIDATFPWDLLWMANELLRREVVPSEISSAASVHDSAIILEPVVIDADTEIGPGAVVGPNVCIGENGTIGANAVVQNSVLDADVRVGASASIHDCVTGRGVDIGTGSQVVGGPGDVRVNDRVHENQPLGALLADRVTDEGGVTYAPGTMIGSSSLIRAGATVRGTIDSGVEVLE